MHFSAEPLALLAAATVKLHPRAVHAGWLLSGSRSEPGDAADLLADGSQGGAHAGVEASTVGNEVRLCAALVLKSCAGDGPVPSGLRARFPRRLSRSPCRPA